MGPCQSRALVGGAHRNPRVHRERGRPPGALRHGQRSLSAPERGRRSGLRGRAQRSSVEAELLLKRGMALLGGLLSLAATVLLPFHLGGTFGIAIAALFFAGGLALAIASLTLG